MHASQALCPADRVTPAEVAGCALQSPIPGEINAASQKPFRRFNDLKRTQRAPILIPGGPSASPLNRNARLSSLFRPRGILGVQVLFLLFLPALLDAQSITLAWSGSASTNVVGYHLYYGTASGIYWSRIDAGTNTTTTVAGLTNGITYYFVATAYGVLGDESPASNEASLAVSSSGPPVIVRQPLSQTTAAGTSASFSVVANGPGPMSYQWWKNTAAISGATAATLTLANVSDANAANYTAVVSNPVGIATSSSASLTVIDLPTIVNQPVSATKAAGTTASFSATANGASPLSYQWWKNTTAINGATTATLTLANVSDADAANYTLVVSNPVGLVISSVAQLTVINLPTLPTIVSQPVSTTSSAGTTASFSVTAGGTSPLSYQWLKNAVPIAGATLPTLTLANVSAATQGSYSVTVSNIAGTTTSSAATLTVINNPTIPTIVSEPVSTTSSAGTTASFSVTAGGTGPLGYQWLKSTVPIAGATLATLTLANVSAATQGSYSVTVSNIAGATTSTAATLTVINNPTIPTIVNQPVSTTSPAGATASFSVTAGGTGPLYYQWLKSTVPVTGATLATLTLANISDATQGSYSVTVSNIAGATTSSAATLTVLDPPTIVNQPVSATKVAGSTATFSVTANGPGSLSYQWLKSTVPITGATLATLTLANVSDATQGSYSVTVSNIAGATTSGAATLTVLDPPTIVSQPVSAAKAAGSTATFTVTANGPGSLSYQWLKSAAPSAGATLATLTLANVSDATAGSYSVAVSDTAGTTTSAAVTLTVLDLPAIVNQPVSITNTAGKTVSFSVTATGAGPLSYQWWKNSATISGATAATLTLNNISTADAANYTVVVGNSVGLVISSSASLTVVGAPSQTSLSPDGAHTNTIAKSMAPQASAIPTAGAVASRAPMLVVPGLLMIIPGLNHGDPLNINIHVEPEHWYELEVTTDLKSWAKIGQTGVAEEGAWVEFMDPESRECAARFYRVIRHDTNSNWQVGTSVAAGESRD